MGPFLLLLLLSLVLLGGLVALVVRIRRDLAEEKEEQQQNRRWRERQDRESAVVAADLLQRTARQAATFQPRAAPPPVHSPGLTPTDLGAALFQAAEAQVQHRFQATLAAPNGRQEHAVGNLGRDVIVPHLGLPHVSPAGYDPPAPSSDISWDGGSSGSSDSGPCGGGDSGGGGGCGD